MKIANGKIKLSAGERRAFFACDWPNLAGSGKPPELTQRHYTLSSRLSFTVTKVHRLPPGWRFESDVHDDREEPFRPPPAPRVQPVRAGSSRSPHC